MYRQFVLIALSLSFVVTACNDGGKKRVSLRKGRPVLDAKASNRTKEINKAIGDSPCLRIDKLIKEYMKLKDENVLIYTSDVNIGTMSLTDLDFAGESDLQIRSSATFTKNSIEPVVETIPATKLQHSAIEALMSVTDMDSKCELVAIPGVALTPNFKVMKKSPNELWLRNSVEPKISLRYQYDRVDKFIVTLYKPDERFCGGHGGMRMIKYVIAREAAMQNVELERGFANAIASMIKAPVEMSTELSEQAATRSPLMVTLKTETMSTVRQLLRSDSLTPAVCPSK